MLAVHHGQTRFADAAQILEAPLRGMSTRCEQRHIKRHRHWSRFVGIPQGLSPFSRQGKTAEPSGPVRRFLRLSLEQAPEKLLPLDAALGRYPSGLPPFSAAVTSRAV